MGVFDNLKDSTDRVRNALKSEEQIRAEIADSIDEVMKDEVVPQARRRAPRGDRSDHSGKDGSPGDLKRSIEFRGGHWRDDRYVARVGSDLDYAAAIEFGADGHEITPNDADYLYFYWDNEGKYFRGPGVNHPGNDGQHYLGDTFNDEYIQRSFEESIIGEYETAFRYETN